MSSSKGSRANELLKRCQKPASPSATLVNPISTPMSVVMDMSASNRCTVSAVLCDSSDKLCSKVLHLCSSEPAFEPKAPGTMQ